MEDEPKNSKASYKLDLIETANVDPMVSGADLKVLAAYLAVMSWPPKAWLTASLAQAMTGLSERQFRLSRHRLLGHNQCGRAYLVAARQAGKVSTYLIINPWRDEAKNLVKSMNEFHREAERKKKETKRKRLSLQNLPGQKVACPGKICRSVPAESAAYYPLENPPREEHRRGEDSPGSNVVRLKTERQAS